MHGSTGVAGVAVFVGHGVGTFTVLTGRGVLTVVAATVVTVAV